MAAIVVLAGLTSTSWNPRRLVGTTCEVPEEPVMSIYTSVQNKELTLITLQL